ncbi:MAG: tetratricopeptide repeat protein [Bacillota bacterium]
MRRFLLRAVPFCAVLFLVAFFLPTGAAEGEEELALALRAAEQSGMERLIALRTMLWTEPSAIASSVLPSPSAEEKAFLAEAESRARSALSGPNLLPSLVLLGHLARIDGRMEEAEDYYRRALSVLPAYAPALLGLADLYLDRREAPRAASCLAAIKSAETEILRATALRRAVLALWRGDGAQAVSLLKAWPEPPGDEGWVYLFLLAKGYLQTGLGQEAAGLLAREAPPWAQGLWAGTRALVAQALGEEERAATELFRAAALLPGCPLWRWERAASALARDEITTAAALLEQPGGPEESTVGGLFLLGLIKEEKGDYAAAIKAYAGLLEMRPRLGLAYYHLGRALFAAQRYEEALRYLGQGMAVSPRLPCLYLQRAEVYARLKMEPQAGRERAKAASLPSSAEGGGWGLRLLAAGEKLVLLGLTNREGTPPQGVFFSRDGRHWLWRPWRGAVVPLLGLEPGEKIHVFPDQDHSVLLTGLVPPLPSGPSSLPFSSMP